MYLQCSSCFNINILESVANLWSDALTPPSQVHNSSHFSPIFTTNCTGLETTTVWLLWIQPFTIFKVRCFNLTAKEIKVQLKVGVQSERKASSLDLICSWHFPFTPLPQVKYRLCCLFSTQCVPINFILK